MPSKIAATNCTWITYISTLFQNVVPKHYGYVDYHDVTYLGHPPIRLLKTSLAKITLVLVLLFEVLVHTLGLCLLYKHLHVTMDLRLFGDVPRLKHWWESLKNGPSPASFSFIFVFSNKHHNFLQQIHVKNVHPVYGAEIWTHDLQIMGSAHNH